ncbi:MAG: relaxase/mobilization nuclease domain-containing protein [Alistipes finegoldii]
MDKDEAEVLLWQKMLEPYDKCGRLDIDVCMESFMPYLEANRRTTNTVFHASLNPSPEDRLTDEQLRKIACEYMERMGYGEQPYIVFKHKDISREHLHIVSLRVDEQGRKLPHDFEARRSMEILRDLECKYGLQPSVKGQELTDREGLRKVNYPEGMSSNGSRPSSGRACEITNARPTESFARCWNASIFRSKNVRELSTAEIMRGLSTVP